MVDIDIRNHISTGNTYRAYGKIMSYLKKTQLWLFSWSTCWRLALGKDKVDMPLSQEISNEQLNWWRIALELRLRQCHGDEFQDFFSIVMGLLHGSNFVRVRAYGNLGDKGCDGYLQTMVLNFIYP